MAPALSEKLRMDHGMMDNLQESIILRSDSSKLMDNSEESIIRIPTCIAPTTRRE
jgi:hypothetical protein